MTTYIVICIALIIFVTVILIAAKPIIKGFEARQNIKNFDNIEKKIQVSDSERIERNNSSDLINELNKLNKLFKDGVLSEEEFKKAKEKVLD